MKEKEKRRLLYFTIWNNIHSLWYSFYLYETMKLWGSNPTFLKFWYYKSAALCAKVSLLLWFDKIYKSNIQEGTEEKWHKDVQVGMLN